MVLIIINVTAVEHHTPTSEHLHEYEDIGINRQLPPNVRFWRHLLPGTKV